MNIWQFADNHPFITAFIIYVMAATVFRCWNRLMRHLNIRKHGWPTPPLDADGDVVYPEPEDEDEDEGEDKPRD